MNKAALFVVAALMIAGSAFAENPQKPGEWQISMQMEVPGMPFKMPPVNFTVCLTEEDLKDPQKSVPNDPKNDCKVGDYKIEGNKVSWTVDCPKQKTKGEGEITFTENSYTGHMNMTVGEQEMSTKYTGKWKGECSKKK
jgi:Protein of unknown function (DUF3617)